ncbi:fatty acid synthase subunit alpha reductase [Trichoderma evansii]
MISEVEHLTLSSKHILTEVTTNSERENELAYILLIELLAHQFAYPVRWIQTQDVILSDIQAQRVIEIGPRDILTNMMRQTWNKRFSARDKALSITRQLLGPKGGLEDIYYEGQQLVDNEPQQIQRDTSSSVESKAQSSAISDASHIPQSQHILDAPIGPLLDCVSEDVPDTHVSIPDIVQTIISTKLKKSAKDIALRKTIQELVNGRSALANEVIGDLEAEFPGHIPNKPEELALDELCKTLETNHTGRLGKSIYSIVSKMLSLKFPGKYAISTARQYLNGRFGLGMMRQDAVLLLAAQRQPTTRLEHKDEAEGFLTEIAKDYFRRENLPWPSARVTHGLAGAQAAFVDAEKLLVLDAKNVSLIQNVVELLNSHLPTASEAEDGQVEATPTANGLLSVFLSEHSDDYAEGIKPKFDVRKQRVYDSYWNWCAQDVAMFYVLCQYQQPDHANLVDELATSIVNRACNRSIAQLNHLLKRSQTDDPENEYLINSMWWLHQACLARFAVGGDPRYVDVSPSMAPLTTIDPNGIIIASEVPRISLLHGVTSGAAENSGAEMPPPIFQVSKFRDGAVLSCNALSVAYAADLAVARCRGFSFVGKNILITGAGKNSIGFHILRNLLSGGARVIVTTSSFSAQTTEMYQSLYARHGSKGSILRVVPFNQASQNDVQRLIQWLYADESWDLDFVIPFAALAENGRDLENLDCRSEIAHRLMLTNVLRLLGAVASSKRSRGLINRPATAILPLSPNHGSFGNDGLYSESKISLEPLLAKWYSESWADHLSVLGVTIGWCRGTGLMGSNDIMAQGVEDIGVRTFSASEMAANIVALMGGSINTECQSVPLVIDLGGGLDKIRDIQERIIGIRKSLSVEADIVRAVVEEKLRDAAVVGGYVDANPSVPKRLSTKANIKLPFPNLPDHDRDIAPLSTSLKDMVDLSRVVVITGFSELGPCGSSRTRWDMERNGRLSQESCVEMAWVMGMIKDGSRISKAGAPVSCWVDVETSMPLDDDEIEARYLSTILKHTGLREIEPSICDNNYDPNSKDSIQELVLQRDLPPFETTLDVAEDMIRKHGDKALIVKNASGGCTVQLRTGATIMIPRSSRFNRTVAGQIPTGWSAKRYGISDDIIEQVDPVTLFSLVCTVEALFSTGIVDAYELYQHIHVSELAICIGSGMGGLSSSRQMHRDRFIDRTVKADILQETFVNTIGAWINMLLISSSGPLKTPVGACATSLESLDTAYDLIVTNKAKVALVGGVEDFTEDVSFEFGSMKATCNTDAEFAAGRRPAEMSRPTASSRSGFVESQGCGIQVLTTAELAIRMGLPIYGIVAYTSMSADKIGRSVPAPGHGIVTNAREDTSKSVSPPLLDMEHRRQMLSRRRQQIAAFVQDGLDQLEAEVGALRQLNSCILEEDLDQYRQSQITVIQQDGKRQNADATFRLGNDFWRGNPQISPIRGSLATWGLNIDDISVASLHGTSTVQNDINEPYIIQEQMRHLGRQEGNLLPCVCQKWLTGHSKGAAGAWMLNGCLQMIDSGVVPGNRNVDNVEETLRQHPHLWFPNTTLRSGQSSIKACSVTSFGFGQKGAQVILVHPRYLYATISKDEYHEYAKQREMRWRRACRSYTEALINNDMVSSRIKDTPPYAPADEISILLDPQARF